VIASHYAMPLPMTVAVASPLRARRSGDSAALAELHPGEPFEMLDNSLGWAWGYGGPGRLVGYVASEALKPPVS
jgi:hypothetical protein